LRRGAATSGHPHNSAGDRTPLEPTTPPPPLATTIDHDDTYIIGKDIRAGKWHTSGPRPKKMFANGSLVQTLNECHWQLGWPESAAGRRDRGRIAEGDITGPQDVDLNVVGAEFQTKGCGPGISPTSRNDADTKTSPTRWRCETLFT